MTIDSNRLIQKGQPALADRPRRARNAGFSMLEMLIVIIVVAVLVIADAGARLERAFAKHHLEAGGVGKKRVADRLASAALRPSATFNQILATL